MKKIKIVHEQATGNRANLKTLIDQIMSGPNPHPKDSSFRLTVSGWAKPSHGTFDFQGKIPPIRFRIGFHIILCLL